jgi:hypothetical protein
MKQLKSGKTLVIVFFALLFVYGCMTFNDYGISSDEEVQRYHSLVTYHELFLQNEEYQTATIDTTTIPTLSDYGVQYGVILQLPLVFIEHMNHFEMTYQEIFSMRHFYSFLWFFASAICFYQLAMILTDGKRIEALIGTLIYVLCPRTLADSFYNIKDALCMALFTISMYCGVRMIRRPSVRTMVTFIVFAVLCTASRIVGGVIVAVCMLLLVVKSATQGQWKRILIYCGSAALLFLGLFIVMMPNTWSDIPGTLLKIVKTFSNYTVWSANVYYMGQWVSALHLPWHYLPVWIGMTVPATYLILMMLGMGNGVYYCIKNRKQLGNQGDRGWIYWMLFLLLVIPVAYVVIVRPVLYNGWRHFYFIYPVIASWSVVGIHTLLTKIKPVVFKTVGMAALGISFVWVGLWIVRNHPYEYVYFNPWIQSYAEDHFQRDYWYVSETNAFQYIIDNDPRSTIYVYAYQGFTWYFDEEERINPLQLVTSPELADYAVVEEDGFEEEYLFVEKHDISVDHMVIRRILERAYTTTRSFYLSVGGGGQSSYELNGIVWTETDSSENQKTYIGKLATPIQADVVAAIVSDEALIQKGNLQLKVSSDGQNWYSLESMSGFSQYSTRISSYCTVDEVNYIQLTYDDSYTEEVGVRINFCKNKNEITEEDKTNLVIASLSTNAESDSPLMNAIDDNGGSRWESPNQYEGMYLMAELTDEYVLTGAVLELGNSPWDYPKNLIIYVSEDGEAWTDVSAVQVDNETYSFEPVTGRYIRFEIGSIEKQGESHWSVYELRLLTEME